MSDYRLRFGIYKDHVLSDVPIEYRQYLWNLNFPLILALAEECKEENVDVRRVVMEGETDVDRQVRELYNLILGE